MQTREAVLGIDAGTTAVKAVVYDSDATVLGVGRTPARTLPGRDPRSAEQDMDAVYAGAVWAVRQALSAAGDVHVVGIGITGQGDGSWLVDGAGRPVGPTALWLDARAAERTAVWSADERGPAVRRVTGSSVFPGALPVLLDELAQEEPDRLARARHHLNCKDWLRYRLTGVMATDHSEASRTYLDVRTGCYSDELLAALGHERYRALLPELLGPGEVAGTLTDEAAHELGLPPATPVVTGLVDTAAVGAGLGCTRPGDAYAIVGTTGFVGTVRSAPTLPADVTAITLRLGPGDTVVECLAPMSGTPNLDWVRRTLGLADPAAAEAEAGEVAHGAGGVLFLPYSAGGERAPFVDGAASGAWLGTTTATTRAELVRAAYEGLAMAMRECMTVLGTPDAVLLGGGGANSVLFSRVLADVAGRSVHTVTGSGPDVAVPGTDEVGARGVAALAGAAAGWPAWPAAPTGTHRPDPHAQAALDERFAAFLAVRDALRPHWPAIGPASRVAVPALV